MSHTRDTWEVGLYGNTIVDKQGYLIASLPNNKRYTQNQIVEMTHRMAAAPAMLEALEEMLRYVEARNDNHAAKTVTMKFSKPTLGRWQVKARIALALARGEEINDRPTPPRSTKKACD